VPLPCVFQISDVMEHHAEASSHWLMSQAKEASRE